jgi:hypothetical protein
MSVQAKANLKLMRRGIYDDWLRLCQAAIAIWFFVGCVPDTSSALAGISELPNLSSVTAQLTVVLFLGSGLENARTEADKRRTADRRTLKWAMPA